MRGGVFRCFYDLMNVAPKKEDDEENFRKFPGTMGTVNLGVESYNSDLIQDGRIQIVDRYGAGALVLLDEQSSEEADGNGLYHYRLYRGDTELRASSYLEVYPNKKVMTNSSHSMQLCTYDGTGKSTLSVLQEDDGNIRAPYRQTENYFDFQIDDPNNNRWSVMPNFRHSGSGEMDVYGEEIANSEVWYYPVPRKAGTGEPIGDIPYAHTIKNTDGSPLMTTYWSRLRTELIFFTYKVYRVDPLTRENISESKVFGVDEPLISVRYGAQMDDALRCKLPLKEVEAQIKNRRPGEWKGYQQGEMYRIVLSIDQSMGMFYDGKEFVNRLPDAHCESTILFRCYAASETKDIDAEQNINDFTPVQFDLKEVPYEDSVSGRTYMAPVVNAGKTANVHILNGKAGMTDYRGDVKVFDLYYQWWEVEEDGTPVRMIAGTDNIYDKSKGTPKSEHDPSHWNVGKDSKTYVNTLAPDTPNASLYGENGLPINKLDWTDKMLHMYSQELTNKTELTLDGTDNLYLGNNKIFATNTDSCYIPEEMAGKYIQVKVIAHNIEWPMAYDEMQTFKSHIVKVGGEVKELSGEISTKYSNGKNYAAYDQPAVISLGSFDGLYSSEKISSVQFFSGAVSSEEFTSLNTNDFKKVPSVKYPDDFYEKDYSFEKIIPSERACYAVVKTDKGRTLKTPVKNISYEKEAKDIRIVGEASQTFKLSDITSGKHDNGVWTFTPEPYSASTGFNFSTYTSTDKDIVTLDENGRIHFGGKAGNAAVTVKSPTGKDVTVDVTVINDYDFFEVSGIDAPVPGKEFDRTAEVPEGAPYHVKEVNWYKDTKSWAAGTLTSPDDTPEYGHAYMVEVCLESNDYCTSDFSADYSFTVGLPDGTTETINGEHILQGGQQFWISYRYDAMKDPAADTIKEVHLDFPTVVPEGVYFDEWLEENVRFYTNVQDDGFEAEISPAYGEDYMDICYAYGYTDAADIATFIKGVQTGLSVKIKVPDDLERKGYGVDSDVKIIINGEETGHISWSSEDTLLCEALDSLTVTDGTPDLSYPEFRWKDYNLVVGETFALEDLIENASPNMNLYLTGFGGTLDADSVVTYDLSEGTITPIKAVQSPLYVNYLLEYDMNHDGICEFKRNASLYFSEIYATEEDVPENTKTEKNISVKVLDPEGTEAYSDSCKYLDKLSIPEVENAFISNIYDSADEPVYGLSLRYGADRISASFKDGESYTVKTVSADNIVTCAGADSVYAYVNDADGHMVDGIALSVDGIHFVLGDRIAGLTPGTDYTLYYRQGANGSVYTTKVHTASKDYGVYIGRQAVTGENTGDLERDGWHYDPETKTLTLKNLKLRDYGSVAFVETLAGYTMKYDAVIVSKQELNLELIGDNEIEGISNSIDPDIVYAEKDLTVTGNGNITLRNASSGFVSHTSDIYLNGTGRQVFEETINTYEAYKGTIYYSNGTVEYKCGVKEIDGNNYLTGSFISKSDVDRLDFTKSTHTLKIQVGDADGSFTTVTEDSFREQIKEHNLHIRITPIHTDANKVMKAEYLASGSCEEGAEYYYVCECGHIGSAAYKAEAHEHNMTHCEGKPADCFNDGWEAYDVCEDCGYSTYKAIPAAGHKLVHHSAAEASCTENGKAEYWSCENCGELFADDKGTVPAAEEELIIPAAGHSWIHHNAEAPTCTEDGSIEYWTCEHCGLISSDSEGMIIITSEEKIIEHTGHIWSEWVITREPTATEEGEETRICEGCGEKETRSIAKLEVLTTTSTATTTTSSTTTSTSTSSTTSTTTTTLPFEAVEDERVIGTWELYKYVDNESGNTSEVNTEEISYSFKFTNDFKCIVTIENKTDGTSKTTECWWTASEAETGGKDRILIVNAEDTNEKMIADIDGDELSFGFLQMENTTAYMKKKPAEKFGDINGDGIINPVDASLILVRFAELSAPDAEPASDEMIKKYDINGDGRITAVDASLILAYCANLAGDETLKLDSFLADVLK